MSDEKKQGFEDVIQRLEELVGQLETGGLSLDAALKVYEEGVRLARTGNEMLEGAELRIIELQKALTSTQGGTE
jgi:exodeoxyribonuclease VII small subunit